MNFVKLFYRVNLLFTKISFLFFIYFVSILYSAKTFAVGENPPIGARYSGMGGISTVVTDLFSIWHNQAGLADVKRFSAGLIYQNEFMVNELRVSALSIAIPTPTGTIGAGYSVFGYSKFNESRFGLAFGKPFGKKFSAGVQLNYHRIYVADGYGSKGTVTVEGGFIVKPLDNLIIGVSIFNPTKAKIPEDGYECLPLVMTAGIGYHVSSKALICFETEKEQNNKEINRFGMEYKVFDNFWIRSGVAVNPALFSFGMGYLIKRIKFDIAFSRHYILGYSPHISLAYEF